MARKKKTTIKKFNITIKYKYPVEKNGGEYVRFDFPYTDPIYVGNKVDNYFPEYGGDIIDKCTEQGTFEIPIMFYTKGFSSIRNQRQAHSSVAIAIAQIIEFFSDQHEPLSPLFLFLPNTCMSDGLTTFEALECAIVYGTCTEYELPYFLLFDSVMRPYIRSDMIESAKRFKMASYIRLDKVMDVIVALLNIGPCYILLPCYGTHGDFWVEPFNSSCLSDDDRSNYDGTKTYYVGNQAAVIVGYTNKEFILRNSWGRLWNDNGHTSLPFCEWGTQLCTYALLPKKSKVEMINIIHLEE